MFKEIQENYADQIMKKKSGGGLLATSIIGGGALYGAKKMVNSVQDAAKTIENGKHEELIQHLTDSEEVSQSVDNVDKLNLFDESNGFMYRHNPKYVLNENTYNSTFANRYRYLKD